MTEHEKFKVHASRRLCSAVLCAFVDNHQRLRRSSLPLTIKQVQKGQPHIHITLSMYVCGVLCLCACVCVRAAILPNAAAAGRTKVCLPFPGTSSMRMPMYMYE